MSNVRPPMREFVQRLATTYAVECIPRTSATSLLIDKGQALIFEITVPDSPLEWFVEGRISGTVAWSDWADYYAMQSESHDELTLNMMQDLQSFLQAVLEREIRLVSQRSTSSAEDTCIEWKIDGQWRALSVSMA